jgi:hypothetical protein
LWHRRQHRQDRHRSENFVQRPHRPRRLRRKNGHKRLPLRGFVLEKEALRRESYCVIFVLAYMKSGHDRPEAPHLPKKLARFRTSAFRFAPPRMSWRRASGGSTPA